MQSVMRCLRQTAPPPACHKHSACAPLRVDYGAAQHSCVTTSPSVDLPRNETSDALLVRCLLLWVSGIRSTAQQIGKRALGAAGALGVAYLLMMRTEQQQEQQQKEIEIERGTCVVVRVGVRDTQAERVGASGHLLAWLVAQRSS